MYSLHGDEFGRHAMLDMLQNSWLIGQVFDGWESGTQALFGDVMLFNATEEERRLAIGLCNHYCMKPHKLKVPNYVLFCSVLCFPQKI